MGRGLKFTGMLAFGGLCGYAAYLAKNKKYSNITVDKYNDFFDNAKDLGSNIKTAYSSLDDKDIFNKETNHLKHNAKELIKSTAGLITSAFSDITRDIAEKMNEKLNEDDSFTKKKKNK